MIVQIMGCNCSGNDFYTLIPAGIFQTKREFIHLKHPDTYSSTTFNFNNTKVTIEASTPPVFFKDAFYKSFLKQDSLKVYVFPSSKRLIDVANKDYLDFLKFVKQENIVHVLNHFSGGGKKEDFFTKEDYQSKYNIQVNIETRLGPNGYENMTKDFLSALSVLTALNRQ